MVENPSVSCPLNTRAAICKKGPLTYVGKKGPGQPTLLQKLTRAVFAHFNTDADLVF